MMLFHEYHLLNLPYLRGILTHMLEQITDTWKSVIGKYAVTGMNENGRYLLQLCCSNGLCIMNTFFQHREVHKYTWYRPSMDPKSLIDFCIVSSDLFSDILDVRVKRGVELSIVNHLIVCSLKFSKPWPNRKSNRSSLTHRIRGVFGGGMVLWPPLFGSPV